jgi:hypothetical protein
MQLQAPWLELNLRPYDSCCMMGQFIHMRCINVSVYLYSNVDKLGNNGMKK